VLHALLIAGAIIYIFAVNLPHENALSLAADGKLNLTTVWGYRFRHSGLLAIESQPALLIALFKIFGVKAFWCATILLQTLVLMGRNRVRRGFFACFAGAAVIFAPGLVFWSATLAGLTVSLRSLQSALQGRQADKAESKTAKYFGGAVAALLTFGSIYCAMWLANPLHHVHRQRVLGGKSFHDGIISAETGSRLQLRKNCLAVINPDDLRAVNSLEKFSLASLRATPALALLDLKVVESNYRLLTLRNEKGAFVFTDEARAFASTEKKHSEKLLPAILAAGSVCLVANFDTMPGAETAPFSRAREIYERRKKAGLDTQIIQLPNQ